MRNKPLTWHIIVNASRRILAVYGEALLKEAEAKRDELRKQFPLAVIDLESREWGLRERPHVGDIA